MDRRVQTYTYVAKGKFELTEKPKPVLLHERDAIVKVTLASICSSDLHIKHGSVPRAVPGITVGHEMVGIVEAVGSAVKNVKPGDRLLRLIMHIKRAANLQSKMVIFRFHTQRDMLPVQLPESRSGLMLNADTHSARLRQSASCLLRRS